AEARGRLPVRSYGAWELARLGLARLGSARLEHGVGGGGGIRDRLAGVPVLDGLAVADAEQLDAGEPAVVRVSLEVVVDRDVIALRDHALDIDDQVREVGER